MLPDASFLSPILGERNLGGELADLIASLAVPPPVSIDLSDSEAEEKFAALVKEQKILTKENAERAEEQALLAKARKIRLESLERKVSWLTRRCLFFLSKFPICNFDPYAFF